MHGEPADALLAHLKQLSDEQRERALERVRAETRDPSVGVRELLDWWNDDAPALSPVISSAIVHYRFEAIHPFADGNGRGTYYWRIITR